MRHVAIMLRRVIGLVALLMMIGAGAGGARAQEAHACPDDPAWKPPLSPAGCAKEIRIWNNLGEGHTIYVVWQGSKQLQEAIGCREGDVWLQRALNDTTKCFPVKNTYLAFINPVTGIANGKFVSISIPWWSRNAPEGAADADPYIDWWRAGRIYIFDDQAALNDSYKDSQKTLAALATPGPTCNTAAGNACIADELKIYKVPDGSSALISDHTPFQLNEVTFADIGSVPVTGGKFISLNLNYNVSYVDQIYLPLAIGPIRQAKDIGYMGTIMDVDKFRAAMATFSGNGTKWPVYNNPNNKYPKAGIRLPSTLAAFNFYMAPTIDPQQNPVIIPASPPSTLQAVQANWENCTAAAPADCPQSAMYGPISRAFLDSYAGYIGNCNDIPAYLTQKPGSNPPVPSNAYALLRFVHGWVPFNVNCAEPPLPTADLPPDRLGNAPINSIALQYNWEQPAIKPEQWFNPYTQFIHGTLNANSYAFSIDDAASVANVAGDGLIFAIGGRNGLENETQFPPPLPTFYNWYTFSVALGAGGAGWKSYQLCAPQGAQPNEVMFPPGAQSPNSPPGWGMNPALYRFPCTITLTDNRGSRYQLQILEAGIPQNPIWPPHPPGVFDPKVVACPDVPGFVKPPEWCARINEVATPANGPTAPQYSLSLPGPL